MKTRMEKYYTEQIPTVGSTRASKNKELYKEVNTTELKDFNLNSNVSVLDDNSSSIDLEKVKDLLDEKYQKEPKRELNIKKIEPLPIEKMDLDETREYDINAILEQAKETKEVDYEVDRLKKVRNTQYDILNNLDLEKTVEDEEDFTKEQAKLMDLINTITSKEMATEVNKKLTEEKTPVAKIEKEEPALDTTISSIATKEFTPPIKNEETITKEFKSDDTFDNLLATTNINPLDLFSDLKGDNEETAVIGAKQEVKKEEIKKEEPNKSISKIEKNMENTKERLFNTMTMENTLSNSSQFSQSDFDDFNDLKDDMKAAKLVIKILIVLVIIAFIVGCIFLANNIFNLGLL